MNRTSQHSEMEELLPAAALEILDGEELVRVQAHARNCPECAELLDHYREAIANVALRLSQQRLEAGRSTRLRQRLLARAAAAPPTPEKDAARSRSPWAARGGWAGWAVAAGLAGVLLVHHGFHRPLAYGWIVAGVLAIALVAVGVYARIQRGRIDALEDQLSSRDRDSASS